MVVDSILVHYDTLLNNPTDIITKCASLLLNQAKVITKYVRFLITKCDSFIKICELLHNASILLQNASFITKRVGKQDKKQEKRQKSKSKKKCILTVCYSCLRSGNKDEMKKFTENSWKVSIK